MKFGNLLIVSPSEDVKKNSFPGYYLKKYGIYQIAVMKKYSEKVLSIYTFDFPFMENNLLKLIAMLLNPPSQSPFDEQNT